MMKGKWWRRSDHIFSVFWCSSRNGFARPLTVLEESDFTCHHRWRMNDIVIFECRSTWCRPGCVVISCAGLVGTMATRPTYWRPNSYYAGDEEKSGFNIAEPVNWAINKNSCVGHESVWAPIRGSELFDVTYLFCLVRPSSGQGRARWTYLTAGPASPARTGRWKPDDVASSLVSAPSLQTSAQILLIILRFSNCEKEELPRRGVETV